MRFSRFFITLSLLLFSVSALPLRGELIWSRDTGWQLEGGVLAGLGGDAPRTALNLMNEARLHEEDGNQTRAIRLYRRVAKDFPNSIYAPEALFRHAGIRLQRQQYFRAFDSYQDIVRKYPNNDRFLQVIEQQYRIATLLLDGARTRIFGVIPGFKSRERSIEYFERILVNAPYSDYAPLSLLNIARAHDRLGNEIEAIDALDRLVNTYPQSLVTPEAYLKLAQAHAALVAGPNYDQSSTREAISYFEDFLILFPDTAFAGEAEEGLSGMRETLAQSKMRIGDFYFYKRSNYTAARILYNEAITVYPNSRVASTARDRLIELDQRAAEEDAGIRRKRFFLF